MRLFGFGKKQPEPAPEPVFELPHDEPAPPEVVVAPPEPEPAPAPYVAPEPVRIPQRPLSEHELHVKAHHERIVACRKMDEGPEKQARWAELRGEADDIRAYKRLNFTQESLQSQFWELQFQIEDLKVAWEAASKEARASIVKEIDELSKHRSHIVYALKRKDGSGSVTEPIGHTGPRPVR